MKKGWNSSLTNSAAETISLGIEISSLLEKGDILTLNGELASGKTTFVKGILEGLDFIEDVTSPTFTLVNEYHAKFTVVHIDAYREDDLNRWVEVGFCDYLNSENIVIIEWADRIAKLLPEDSIKINFSHQGDNKRKIMLLDK